VAQIPSREANSHSASQKITRHLWKVCMKVELNVKIAKSRHVLNSRI
jgi:hypothetical protein